MVKFSVIVRGINTRENLHEASRRSAPAPASATDLHELVQLPLYLDRLSARASTSGSSVELVHLSGDA